MLGTVIRWYILFSRNGEGVGALSAMTLGWTAFVTSSEPRMSVYTFA